MYKPMTSFCFLMSALIALFLVNCGKDSSSPTGPVTTPVTLSLMAGKWVVQSSHGDIYITTDTAATIRNNNQPGTGAITVAGDYNVNLTYVGSVNMFISIIKASDQPVLDNTLYPRHDLYIFSALGNQNQYALMQFKAFNSKTDSVVFNARLDTNSYHYDSTTCRLAFTMPVFLYRQDDSSHTVTVRGTLTGNVVSVPAHVSTQVLSPTDLVNNGLAIIYRADSTYAIVDTNGIDTTSRGVWTLSGSTLTMFEQAPRTDTTVNSVTLIGSTLTAVANEEYCDAINQTNCYGLLELTLGLASGSIDSASMISTYTLLKQ